MPVGHTYSVGFTQMHAPTPSRRRVGAYVLHVCTDTTTPVSHLDIHQDLVTFGGFTPATARLALVDGQPPSDFSRPGTSWLPAVPLHTPALEFGAYPSAFPAPSTSSSLSTATTTPSVSAASTVVTSTPPTSQVVTVPNFDAIVVPPVVTFDQSPPARSQVSESVYQVLSVPMSPAESPETASTTASDPTPVSHVHSTSAGTAPILQWPLYPADGPPSSMPVLDASSVPFPDLLCVPANTSTTAWPSTPASTTSTPVSSSESLTRLIYSPSGAYSRFLRWTSRVNSAISLLHILSPTVSCFLTVRGARCLPFSAF